MPQLSDPRGFNALDVLNISHENYYSKVFAWLLDPRASHGRRRFFLDWFLRRCGEGRGAKFESVRTEEALGGDERTAKNRTDISLRCKGLLVFVETPESRRRALSETHRGWGGDEVAKREAHQTPLARKRELAHHLVRNDGTQEQLWRQVQALWERIVGTGTP